MKNIFRYAILIFALSLAMGVSVAQEHEAAQPPQAEQPQAEQPKQQATPETGKAAERGAAAEAGQKHESALKAEEEEEENATLKYSPSVTALGKKIGMSPQASYWAFTGLNFAVVLGLIVWLVKSKVLAGMRERTASIRSAMEIAKKASEDAKARLAAIEDRLTKLDTEVAGLKTQAENDFKAEEQRIREQAEQDAARVVQMAEQEIATAAKTARRELKVFAANLAVSLAEKRITVDRDTDEQIVHTFVSQLGKGGK